MARIPQINSANNPESPDRCVYCAELFNLGTARSPWDRAQGHQWIGLLERVLQSWHVTLRAALLLVIALAVALAIIVVLGTAGPYTVLDLPCYIIRRGRP